MGRTGAPSHGEAERLRHEERVLSWVRVVAALVGVVMTTTFESPWPGGGKLLATATVALIGLVGVGALRYLTADRSVTEIHRARHATLVADAVLVLTLSLLHAWHDFAISHTLVLFLPLEGALKAGPRGALRIGAVILVDTVVRAGIRLTVFDLPFDAAQASFLLVAGGIVTAAAVLLSRSAEQENKRARELARRESRARVNSEALHGVILAGLEDVGPTGLTGIAGHIARSLDVPFLAVARRDGDHYTVVSAHGLENAAVGESIDPIPGGPLEEMAERLEPVLVTPDVVAGMEPGSGDTQRTALIPIVRRQRAVGVIIVESPRPEAFEDLGQLRPLAAQLALLFQVQSAFEQEAEVAEHYRHLDRLKDDFLAVASHEIRTPLTAISGIAEMLHLAADRIPPTGLPELHETLWRNANRMGRLLQDLEQLSKLQRGELQLDARPFDVADIVERLGAHTRPRLRLNGGDDVTFLADPIRVGEVLRRLLDNADQHAPDAAVELTWRQDGDTVAIRVRDHGPGVDPELHVAIFEAYGRGTEALRHQRGMGLGLTLSRELCRRMGGELWLDARVSEGACFVVELPAQNGVPRSPRSSVEGPVPA